MFEKIVWQSVLMISGISFLRFLEMIFQMYKQCLWRQRSLFLTFKPHFIPCIMLSHLPPTWRGKWDNGVVMIICHLNLHLAEIVTNTFIKRLYLNKLQNEVCDCFIEYLIFVLCLRKCLSVPLTPIYPISVC